MGLERRFGKWEDVGVRGIEYMMMRVMGMRMVGRMKMVGMVVGMSVVRIGEMSGKVLR